MPARTSDGPGQFTLHLTLAEAQLIFEALAELPFKYVYELIGKLNSRANEIASREAGTASQAYVLEAQELALVIRALGALPFNRVHGLLAKLNEQGQVSPDAWPSVQESVAHGYTKNHT